MKGELNRKKEQDMQGTWWSVFLGIEVQLTRLKESKTFRQIEVVTNFTSDPRTPVDSALHGAMQLAAGFSNIKRYLGLKTTTNIRKIALSTLFKAVTVN